MAHDVICAKDTVDADRPEFAMTENAQKLMLLHNIGLLPTNHTLAYSIMAYRRLQGNSRC